MRDRLECVTLRITQDTIQNNMLSSTIIAKARSNELDSARNARVSARTDCAELHTALTD